MPVISVRIPQLGEGLHEALLVEFLKQPGDVIKRDEPIYVMETDKATTDVESPYEGTLLEWTVPSGSVLEIGTEIAKMEVADGVKEMSAGHRANTSHESSSAADSTRSYSTVENRGAGSSATAPHSMPTLSKLVIPPKTRKYLKDLGLLDDAEKIPRAGSKLMPAEVDAYLAGSREGGVSSDLYQVHPLPKSQIVLNYRLGRGARACVPVTVMNEVDWTAIRTARNRIREHNGPTSFSMVCYAVVSAMKTYEKFRSSLSSDGLSLKVFHHVNLGVAVALPGDEMVTAVIRKADEMSPDEFFAAYHQQVSAARKGQDQADESTTLTVSNMGQAGIRFGIPAIVAPAVATLAIGEVYQHPVPDGDGFKFQPMVTATMSFDHRIANGVGAANFMNEIKKNIESFELN